MMFLSHRVPAPGIMSITDEISGWLGKRLMLWVGEVHAATLCPCLSDCVKMHHKLQYEYDSHGKMLLSPLVWNAWTTVTYLQDITEYKMAATVTTDIYLNANPGELIVERNTDIFLSGLSKHAEPMPFGKKWRTATHLQQSTILVLNDFESSSLLKDQKNRVPDHLGALRNLSL